MLPVRNSAEQEEPLLEFYLDRTAPGRMMA